MYIFLCFNYCNYCYVLFCINCNILSCNYSNLLSCLTKKHVKLLSELISCAAKIKIWTCFYGQCYIVSLQLKESFSQKLYYNFTNFSILNNGVLLTPILFLLYIPNFTIYENLAYIQIKNKVVHARRKA